MDSAAVSQEVSHAPAVPCSVGTNTIASSLGTDAAGPPASSLLWLQVEGGSGHGEEVTFR